MIPMHMWDVNGCLLHTFGVCYLQTLAEKVLSHTDVYMFLLRALNACMQTVILNYEYMYLLVIMAFLLTL